MRRTFLSLLSAALAWGALIGAAQLLGGCSQSTQAKGSGSHAADPADRDAQSARQWAREAAGKGGSTAEHFADSASASANQAGDTFVRDVKKERQLAWEATETSGAAAERFAGRAAVMADNDQTSMAVKSALVAAKDMNTTRLRVDTNGKRVTLSGAVPTAGQKIRASRIARNVLGSGYRVNNHLTVGGF